MTDPQQADMRRHVHRHGGYWSEAHRRWIYCSPLQAVYFRSLRDAYERIAEVAAKDRVRREMSKRPVTLRRRCRATGTIVELAAPGVEADESEGWQTICSDHGGVVGHATKRAAMGWLSHPDEWCPTCQERRP